MIGAFILLHTSEKRMLCIMDFTDLLHVRHARVLLRDRKKHCELWI
jgi:hypothetical protein